ncbi:MAG: YbgA family protein [Candidatus Ratteibacteria bacterium]
MNDNHFARPVIVLSACLNSEPVRYNGEIIRDAFVEKLKNFVDVITVCPEIEIGLSVPRDPIKLYFEKDTYRIYQTKTGLDLTAKLIRFSTEFLNHLKNIDGFLLKGKSPSCGFSGTKVYRDKNAKDILKRGMGLFAQIVKEKLPDKPIEDELRLKNSEIRHHFLASIFAHADMRNIKKNAKSIRELIDFHTRYKYLLMLYSQKTLNHLGRIVAGYKKGSFEQTLSEYEKIFYTAFARKPGVKKHYNVLQHIYGYFSDKIKSSEKRHFLSLMKKLENEQISLSAVIEIIRNFALRFENSYLMSQKYFSPYPEQLESSISG